MDGQHQYEINLKKDDLFICLLSDDVYFISKQMDKWFRILLDDSYVPVSLPQRPEPQPVAPQPAPAQYAESIPMAQPAIQAAPMPEPVPQPQLQPAPQPQPAMAGGQFIPAAQAQMPQAVPMPTPESNQALAEQIMQQSLQQAAAQPAQPSLQDVLEQVGQPNLPAFVPQQAPDPQSVLSNMPAQPVANAYQDVNLPLAQAPMQQQMPAPQPPVAQPVMQAPEMVQQPVEQVLQQQAPPQPMPQPQVQPPQPALLQPVAVGAPSAEEDQDFEAVMNSLLRDFEEEGPVPSGNVPSFQSPAMADAKRERIEPDLSGVTSLADLCDRSNAANSEDYLLLSAYYLTRLERQETFSLKKVNSVLVKSGLTPVNHSVLETVLSNGYLSMLPDLTGTAEVTEYMISGDGLEAAMALL
jgi:hypothetical protein